MNETTTISKDLRHTAVTVAAAELSAYGAMPSFAAVEAGLDAATPYLLDAFLIRGVLAAADAEQVEGDIYMYLLGLQRRGALPLRTLRLGEEVA